MRRFLPFLVLLALTGCGGSAPVVEPPPPAPVVEPPPGPAFVAAVVERGQVAVHDLRTGARRTVGGFGGEVASRHAAPAGSSSVVAIADADSVRLVHADPARGTLRVVASRPVPVRYTVAWAPDGSAFAYGYYRPTTRDARPSMGEGDIRLHTVADGGDRRVGCSASRAVLAWLPQARLLVRDSENLYVVDRSDCTTRSTVDARRMHHLTASPDGAHVVYVHRELVYDRSSGQYVADSTFMIAGPDGSDERPVVGFRYRPERFAWRPDGTELAYDVQNPDRPGQRLVSIFDVASGRSTYLHAPTADGPSEFDPHWSPDGSRILYRQTAAGATVLAVRTFADPYAVVLDGSEGAEPAGWAGPDAVVVRLASGAARVIPLHGGSPFDLPDGAVPLAVAPAG